jgi:hypothetical protein
MNRGTIILILTMPFWLGGLLLIGSLNPLLILVPCGIVFILFLLTAIAFIHSAELRTFDDWDLVIRSILYRLGVQVQPPKSLMHEHELDLSNPENWEHHHPEDEEH